MDFVEKMLASLGEDVNKDEMEAGLKSYVESMVAEKMPELKKHSETLLSEKKALQKQFEEFKDQMKWLEESELDAEKFKELSQEMERLKASSSTTSADIKAIKDEMYESGKKTKEAELTPLLEKATTEISMFKEKSDQYRDKYVEYQKEIKLNEVFNKLNIDDNPFTRQGIKAFAKTEYNEMDDQLGITMFDPSQNKQIPLTDWMNSFPNTDAGKAIIKVPVNTGGGANGGSGGKGEETVADIWNGMFPSTN